MRLVNKEGKEIEPGDVLEAPPCECCPRKSYKFLRVHDWPSPGKSGRVVVSRGGMERTLYLTVFDLEAVE